MPGGGLNLNDGPDLIILTEMTLWRDQPFQ
jgi:hypothetical protein